MANFTTLYSGSSGNCAYIEEDGHYLLVDMGKSSRITQTALRELGAAPDGLEGILVTHEHIDHVRGLGVFLKQRSVPVYGCAATLDYLADRGMVPPNAELVELEGREDDVGGFGVQSFATSHDSVACCGYRVTTPKGRVLAIATDLGFVSDEVLANLLLADAVALEANYDLHMLMTGPYPYYLKTRIASKRGHLCNDESAETLFRLLENGCERFALCHLSEENNAPELVKRTVGVCFAANGVAADRQCILQTQLRHEISPIITF